MFRGLERFLENAVEDRAGAAAGLRLGVGVFHLSEDFCLSEHLGIQARGDLDEVADRLGSVQVEPDSTERVRVEILPRAEGSLDARHDGGVGGDPVELDAVAGAEHRELAEPGQRGELGPQSDGALRGEREFLAHLERRAVVGRADDEKHGAAQR